MLRKLHLGILYKNDKAVNHRSLIKVLLNPLFRYFGFQMVSVMLNNSYINGYRFTKCESRPIKWSLKHNDYDYIVRKRRLI